MAHSTDLHPILRGYALRNNTPVIAIPAFLEFLENYALHWTPEQPEWGKWTVNTEKTFWGELPALVESEKCVLLPDSEEDRLYMPFYCLEKLREMYMDSGRPADMPFPSEEYFKVRIPESQMQIINLGTDMDLLFEQIKKTIPLPAVEEAGSGPAAGVEPAPPPVEEKQAAPPENRREVLIKIVFPEPYQSALVPSGMIPRRLLETSFVKLRNYLLSHGNKEYVLHKLGPHLTGREKYLHNIVDQLLIHPSECFRNLESGGDFSSLFWTFFCSLVKTDIKKKNELLPEDVSAIQAAYLVELCNVFYKNRESKRKERDLALHGLDKLLDRQPLYFTLDDIARFTNEKEVPLLNIYSKRDLEEHIKKKTTKGKKGELPDWLILQGKNGERWFIKKNKYLHLCTRLLISCRANVKKELTSRWVHLLKERHKEPAMEKDDDFDKLLAVYTENENPVLQALLDDPKLTLVYAEMENSHAPIPPASRIVKAGRLLSLSALYAFRRKDLLSDAKFALPFWYSIPFLSVIVVFFKYRKKKKGRKKQPEETAADFSPESPAKEGQIQSLARRLESELVPAGLSLNDYLADLESRWSRLIDEEARQHLISDVRALIRDNLRYAVRIHKTKKLSPESLKEIADFIIANSAALQRLGGRQSLRQYMQLYMVKLLGSTR